MSHNINAQITGSVFVKQLGSKCWFGFWNSILSRSFFPEYIALYWHLEEEMKFLNPQLIKNFFFNIMKQFFFCSGCYHFSCNTYSLKQSSYWLIFLFFCEWMSEYWFETFCFLDQRSCYILLLFRHIAELQAPLVLKNIYFFVKVHFIIYICL